MSRPHVHRIILHKKSLIFCTFSRFLVFSFPVFLRIPAVRVVNAALLRTECSSGLGFWLPACAGTTAPSVPQLISCQQSFPGMEFVFRFRCPGIGIDTTPHFCRGFAVEVLMRMNVVAPPRGLPSGHAKSEECRGRGCVCRSCQ